MLKSPVSSVGDGVSLGGLRRREGEGQSEREASLDISLLREVAVEAWILSRPALSTTNFGPASEIFSLVIGDDFSDRLLADLVVQAQIGVNMASIWRQYGVWYGHYGRLLFLLLCHSSGHAQCYSKC